jgi:hypothetical protein
VDEGSPAANIGHNRQVTVQYSIVRGILHFKQFISPFRVEGYHALKFYPSVLLFHAVVQDFRLIIPFAFQRQCNMSFPKPSQYSYPSLSTVICLFIACSVAIPDKEPHTHQYEQFGVPMSRYVLHSAFPIYAILGTAGLQASVLHICTTSDGPFLTGSC